MSRKGLFYRGLAALLTVGAAMAGDYKLLVIIGATASGKSALAGALARKSGGEILSVDSMQVYRGMDIGTAKATAAERAEIRHHLIDVVDPAELFTVARFVEMADRAIADAATRKVPLIATGGTPLYYKSLFTGLFEGPAADPEVRARLAALSNEQLHQKLSEVDPQSAARIHVNDTKRLVRALEVFELTGRPISSLQREWEAPRARHEAVWVGISWEKDALNRRINARVKEMMNAGWLEETRRLLASYGALSKTASEATGYQELIEHIQGRQSLDDAVEQIKIATRQLARKQMKWFRRFENVTWIAGDSPLQSQVDQAMRVWERG